MSVDDTYMCAQDWALRHWWLLGNEDEDGAGKEKHKRWANQKKKKYKSTEQMNEMSFGNADRTNII